MRARGPSALQEGRCHRELWPSRLLGSGTLKTRPAVPSSHLTVLSIHLCANPSAQNSFVFKGLFTRCQSHCSGPGWVASWLPVVLTFGRHPSCTCGSLGAAVRACEKKPGDVGGQRGRHRASVSHFTSPQAVREPSSCAVPCPVWPGGEGCVCPQWVIVGSFLSCQVVE